MRLRPWYLFLVLAALLVPIQAGALKGSDGPGGAALAVSASLDHCGVGDGGIVCRLNVSWTGIEGAERYSAAVTLADGSVRDMGTIGTGPGGGFTTLWVPYAGDGTYSVTVTAWGSDPDGKEKKISDQDSTTEAEPKQDENGAAEEEQSETPEPDAGGEDGGEQAPGEGQGEGESGAPGQTPPAPVAPPAPVEPEPTAPDPAAPPTESTAPDAAPAPKSAGPPAAPSPQGSPASAGA